jgi:hypothetical protein
MFKNSVYTWRHNRHHYRGQAVNAVYENNVILLSESYETHKHIVWGKCSYWTLMLIVRIINTGPQEADVRCY